MTRVGDQVPPRSRVAVTWPTAAVGTGADTLQPTGRAHIRVCCAPHHLASVHPVAKCKAQVPRGGSASHPKASKPHLDTPAGACLSRPPEARPQRPSAEVQAAPHSIDMYKCSSTYKGTSTQTACARLGQKQSCRWLLYPAQNSAAATCLTGCPTTPAATNGGWGSKNTPGCILPRLCTCITQGSHCPSVGARLARPQHLPGQLVLIGHRHSGCCWSCCCCCCC